MEIEDRSRIGNGILDWLYEYFLKKIWSYWKIARCWAMMYVESHTNTYMHHALQWEVIFGRIIAPWREIFKDVADTLQNIKPHLKIYSVNCYNNLEVVREVEEKEPKLHMKALTWCTRNRSFSDQNQFKGSETQSVYNNYIIEFNFWKGSLQPI